MFVLIKFEKHRPIASFTFNNKQKIMKNGHKTNYDSAKLALKLIKAVQNNTKYEIQYHALPKLFQKKADLKHQRLDLAWHCEKKALAFLLENENEKPTIHVFTFFSYRKSRITNNRCVVQRNRNFSRMPVTLIGGQQI